MHESESLTDLEENGMETEHDSMDPQENVESGKRKGRSLKWDASHLLVLVGVILSYVYLYMHNDLDVFIILLLLTIGVGAVTAVVWKFTASFTVEAFKSVFDFLHGKNDLLCRIKSPQSEPGSLLDHLYMAVEWSLFPTLVVFFVLSFIAQGIAQEGKAVVENDLIYVFMFLIPPVVTFIAIPIRLLTDSSLMKYDIQKRILEPFGLTFRRMFRAVGGVGALASFAKVALDKGGIENTVWDTFTILLYVFPTLFIASILYGIWHPRYLGEVEAKIERFHYSLYLYSRNSEGVITLIPVPEVPRLDHSRAVPEVGRYPQDDEAEEREMEEVQYGSRENDEEDLYGRGQGEEEQDQKKGFVTEKRDGEKGYGRGEENKEEEEGYGRAKGEDEEEGYGGAGVEDEEEGYGGAGVEDEEEGYGGAGVEDEEEGYGGAGVEDEEEGYGRAEGEDEAKGFGGAGVEDEDDEE